MTTLTNHKKSIRAMAMATKQHVFMSAGGDNVKQWSARDGTFLRNFSGHNAVLNGLVVNDDDVMISGGDDGSLRYASRPWSRF